MMKSSRRPTTMRRPVLLLVRLLPLLLLLLLLLLLVALPLVPVTSATLLCDELDGYFGGVDNEAYLSWFQSVGVTRDYTVAAYFAASEFAQVDNALQGAALHWKIVNDDTLHVAVVVRSANSASASGSGGSTGWVGLGLADAGGMKGADMVYYQSSQPGILTDAYADREAQPLVDDCQDWVFVDSFHEGGFLIVEGMRKLDTTDVNDHAIVNDADPFTAAQRVIFAWGDDASITNHGTNIAKGGLHWYTTNTAADGNDATAFVQRMNATADAYFDVRVGNHSLRAIETDYVDFCFAWSDFADQGVPQNGSVTLVGIAMLLDDVASPYVHHATFNGRRTPPTSTSSGNTTCTDPWRDYDYPLYGWAPGTYPFVMPDGVGFTLGMENDGLQGFRITMHYHNPQLVDGVVDNGGLRMYYSYTPVVHEMGIMYMGDSLQKLRGTPLGNGLSEFSFECSAQCSDAVLSDGPVTVFQEYFHMHAKGVAAVTKHYRNGQEIRAAKTNYFDFAQAGIHNIRQGSYQIQAGDSFTSSFYFQDEDDTVMGKGSKDEMCFAALVYYPAKRIYGQAPWVCTYDIPLAVCNASITYTLSSIHDTSFRTFGVQSNGPSECAVPTNTLKEDKGDAATSRKTSQAPSVIRESSRIVWVVVVVMTTLWTMSLMM
jgi:dopamine beta-monooxygenase